MNKPRDSFSIVLAKKYFEKGDIIGPGFNNTTKSIVVVQSNPTRKWWQILIQYCSFSLYKAPWKYEIKIVT